MPAASPGPRRGRAAERTSSLIAGADVVVVTAGRPRTPGMSRADLIGVNARVIQQAAEAIKAYAPNAIVIVVTNPLDEMTVEMLRATGFPRERVLGMAGTLDSSRFRNALALAAGVRPRMSRRSRWVPTATRWRRSSAGPDQGADRSIVILSPGRRSMPA